MDVKKKVLGAIICSMLIGAGPVAAYEDGEQLGTCFWSEKWQTWICWT
jgi:hypothetical protein